MKGIVQTLSGSFSGLGTDIRVLVEVINSVFPVVVFHVDASYPLPRLDPRGSAQSAIGDSLLRRCLRLCERS